MINQPDTPKSASEMHMQKGVKKLNITADTSISIKSKLSASNVSKCLKKGECA